MIQKISDFSEVPIYRLPFMVLSPSKLEFKELSVRIDDEKWPTVRFKLISGNKEFRVKEFFMDWFFTGFPKSIMKDFSSSYSEVQSFTVGDTVIFYGKNYKGLDSITGYFHGTHLEVESNSHASEGEFKVVVSDLLSRDPDFSLTEKMQFPDRSHSSKGFYGEWFENRRISRLNWLRTSNGEYKLHNHRLKASGIGYINSGNMKQVILILEEDNYLRNIWYEIADRGIPIENAVYDMRQGTGFYTKKTESKDGSIIYRDPCGPGILRIEDGTNIVTVGFSPSFSYADIIGFAQHMPEFELFVDKTLAQSLQDMA